MILDLDNRIDNQRNNRGYKEKIAILFGGFDHPQESLHKARKEYAKIASSGSQIPVLLYLTGDSENKQYYILPFNLLFKEDIMEINQSLLSDKHPLILETIKNAQAITNKYADAILSKAILIEYEEAEKMVKEVRDLIGNVK
jgi:hypothetical protein